MPTGLTEYDEYQENLVDFSILNGSTKSTTEILPIQDHSQVGCVHELADHDETGIVKETVDEGQQETQDIPPNVEENVYDETECEADTGFPKAHLLADKAESRNQVEETTNSANTILEESRGSIQSDVLPEENVLDRNWNIKETIEVLFRQLAEYKSAVLRSPMDENQTSTDFHVPPVMKTYERVMSQEVNKDSTAADVCDIVQTFEENDTRVSPIPIEDNTADVGSINFDKDSVSTDGRVSPIPIEDNTADVGSINFDKDTVPNEGPVNPSQFDVVDKWFLLYVASEGQKLLPEVKSAVKSEIQRILREMKFNPSQPMLSVSSQNFPLLQPTVTSPSSCSSQPILSSSPQTLRVSPIPIEDNTADVGSINLDKDTVPNEGFDKLRQGDSQFIMRVGGVPLKRSQLESLEPDRLMAAGIIRSYVALHMKEGDRFVWLHDRYSGPPLKFRCYKRVLFLRFLDGHFTGFIWFIAKNELHYYDSFGNPPPDDLQAEFESVRICSLDHEPQMDGVSCGPLTAYFLAGYGDLGFRFPSTSPDEMKSLRWKMWQKLIKKKEPFSSFCQLCGHTVLQEQYWMCGQCSRAVHFKCNNLSMVRCACHYWSSFISLNRDSLLEAALKML